MEHRLRPLVPFFVDSSDGLRLNDTLSPESERGEGPLVELTVRKWDAEEGVFRPNGCMVRDLPTGGGKKLLTPSEIKRKRMASSTSQLPDVAAGSETRSRSFDDAKRKEDGGKERERKERETERGKEETPKKGRPFAGSTFEAASPAPHGLPIPSFVKKKEDVEEVADVDPAVELRKLLRI